MLVAFDYLNIHRLQFTNLSMNLRSKNLAERMGFIHEGTYRERVFKHGVYHNMDVYSMLSSEFVSIKEKYEADN